MWTRHAASVPNLRVDDTWDRVRKSIGDIRHTLPQGVVGPFFNDEFGDTYGTIYGFTADGFTFRELRDYVENIRSQLLAIPDVSKIDVLGAQDEVVYVDFSLEKLAGLGIDPNTLIAALEALNIVRPAGVLRTGNETISLQVSGAFASEQYLQNVNFSAAGRILRLRDVAEIRRGFSDPPQPMFHVNGKRAIGLAIAMREGGDILTLGRNLTAAMTRITASLPLGIEPTLVADQANIVDHAITDFTSSLWQAILIVLAVSFLALGVRAGAVVAIAIPLTLAIVFPVMEAAAVYAYGALAFAMLSGTLVTIAGFVPIGFARSSAGEYTFSIFAVVAIALIASWFVAVIFAPLLGTMLLKPPKAGLAAKPSRVLNAYRRFLGLAIRGRWVTFAVTLGAFALSIAGLGLVPRQFFPPSTGSSCWSISTCRKTPRSMRPRPPSSASRGTSRAIPASTIFRAISGAAPRAFTCH